MDRPSQDELKADDQGILTGEHGQIWPVVVLRENMIPDMLRRTDLPEGKIPVLYFGTMDIEYVSRDTFQKKAPSYFFQAVSDFAYVEEDSALYSAMSQAAAENSPAVNLQGIRDRWGRVTTDWDRSTGERAKEYQEEAQAKLTDKKHNSYKSEEQDDQELLAHRKRRRLTKMPMTASDGTDEGPAETDGEHRYARSYTDTDNTLAHPHLESAPGRKWTVEEDANLIYLREIHGVQTTWAHRADLWNKAFHLQRTQTALEHRYRDFLVDGATGNHDADARQCQILRDRAMAFHLEHGASRALSSLSIQAEHGQLWSIKHPDVSTTENQTGQPFSAAEDAELIHLKERVLCKFDWHAILQAFKTKFPLTSRTHRSLQDRYRRTLVRDAPGSHGSSPTYCANMRQRAINYLRKTPRATSPQDGANKLMAKNAISLLSDDENGTDDDIGSGDDIESDDNGSGDEETESSHTVQPNSDVSTDSEHEDDPSDRQENGASEQEKQDEEEADAEVEESDDEIDGATVTFLIGRNLVRFCVPVARALGNSYILEDVIEDNNLGAIVTGARWTRLKSKAFRPIYEYLKYGDYHPRIRDGRLLGIKSEHHGHEVVRSGRIFCLAREMQLEELMGLVYRKFELLKKQPLSVLYIIRPVFEIEEDGTEFDAQMRSMLVQDAADNFPAYQIQEAEKFWALQKIVPEFVKAVVKQVAANLDEQETSMT